MKRKARFSERQPKVWYMPLDDRIADVVICLHEVALQTEDISEDSGYHTEFEYDINTFRTDTLTEEEILKNPERYLEYESDYFSEYDRVNFLDTEFVKIDLDNMKEGSITPELIAPGAIKTEHIGEGVITAEQLKDGTVTEDKIALGAISANRLNLTTHILT